MRSFFFNGVIAVFSFLLVLAAAEGFFQLNSSYHWVAEKKFAGIDLQEVPKGDPLPAQILKALKADYPIPLFDQKLHRELNSRISERRTHDAVKFIFPGELIKQQILMEAGLVQKEVVSIGRTQIIDARYSFDSNRIRKSSNKPYDKSKNNLLLMGCSFAFGQSVSDEQTPPAFLAREFPKFNVYNLGVPSSGLTGILNDIHHKDRIGSIAKTGGAAVYLYFSDHFPRHFSSLGTIRKNYPWQGTLDYRIVDGQLVASEVYAGFGLIKLKLLQWLSKSEFLYFTGWGYNTVSIDDQNQFLNFLVFIRDYYKREYNLEFYFHILSPDDVPSRYFYEQLAVKKINVIMYEDFHKVIGDEFIIIPADHHFTPMGNDLLARLIASRLRRDGF